MEPYIKFYKGEIGTTKDNFFIQEIMAFSDSRLEHEHAYIQFVFPNAELSSMQPGAAPVPFTTEEAQNMLQCATVMKRVRGMVFKMMGFWGIGTNGAAVWIMDTHRFNTRVATTNHNQLRVSRMLKFFRMLGWTEYIDNMKILLSENVSPDSTAMRFWRAI